MTSGVARSVSQLVDGLTERGHDADVLSAADGPYLARGDFRFSGLAKRLPQVRRSFDQYDIINVHGPAPTISDAFLVGIGVVPRRPRPGLVYTHHFTVELSHRWIQPLLRSYDLTTRGLARLADHVIVTSGSYADLLWHRQRAEKLSVIPWGVDLDRFESSPRAPRDGPLRALYVGQLRSYKGAHIALQAAANMDDVQLTIIGKGSSELALRRQLHESGASNIDFRGFVADADLVSAYAAHDVVLLPSVNRLEAFGITLLEGMASGCVPLASDLPGVRDLVAECGILTAPNDVVDLRWALGLLSARPELVSRLSERALVHASRYTSSSMIDGYEQVFSDIIESRRRK